jgi:hypothetical protein
MIWNRTFGGPGVDRAYQVRKNSSTGFIIAGYTSSFGGGLENGWFIRTNASGNELGNNTYGGIGNDRFIAFKKTQSGENIVFTGSTTSYGNGQEDVWLVKTNNVGAEIWNRTYGGPLNDSASAVSETNDGGYIIAGMTESYGNSIGDVWLIKTDVNGNETWNKTFGGSQHDSASSLNLTMGGYVMAGETFSYGAGEGDMWLIKTDMNGNETWNKTFGGPGYQHAESFKQYGNGYLIAGADESGPSIDALIVKTDLDGNLISQKTIGGSGDDKAFDIRRNNDNSFALAGSTNSFGLPNRDAWLILISGGS